MLPMSTGCSFLFIYLSSCLSQEITKGSVWVLETVCIMFEWRKTDDVDNKLEVATAQVWLYTKEPATPSEFFLINVTLVNKNLKVFLIMFVLSATWW